MKIAITGATGFIGNQLLSRLMLANHACIPLSRKNTQAEVEAALDGADSLIHLAGEPVAGMRWSEEVKKNIKESRVVGTRNLIDSLSKLPADRRPKTFICASAIGYYGDRGDEVLDEASSHGEGFLSEVVQAWEQEAIAAEKLGMRVIRIRIGVVLGVGGGALEKMQPVILGSGKQWMSWIHINDVTRFILFALEHSNCKGAYNLTSPNPATNGEFTSNFAKASGAGLVLRTPAIAIKLALGEMASIVLDSTRALPKRALEDGFKFEFTDLSSALSDIYPHPLERRFSATQFVPKPVEEVFAFFSRPENLETITPPWLNFKVLYCSTASITEGSLIDYKLKVHGVPMNWQTRIESWVPGKSFVDTQLKGPYRKWHHTHYFDSVPGGTLMRDEVVYQVPGGSAGNMLGGSFIKGDIGKIFSFRKSKIAELFPNG